MRNLVIVLSNATTSLTNFTLTFAVLAYGGATELGTFTLLVSPALVGVTVSRSFITQLWVADGRPTRHAFSLLGGVLAASTAGSAVVMLVIAARPTFWVVVCATPFVIMQDAGRFRCFAAGRPGKALAADAAWLVVSAGGVLWVWAHTPEVAPIIWAWAAGAVCGFVLLLVLRAAQLVTEPVAHVGYSRRTLVAESLTVLALGQVVIYGMPLIASRQELGEFRLIQTLSAPVGLVASAALAHELERARRLGERRRVGPWLLAAPVTVTVFMTPVAIVVVEAMGRVNVEWSVPLVLALVAFQVSLSLTTLSGYRLSRARRDVETRTWFRVRVITAGFEPAVGLPLSAYSGPLGGAIGSLVSQVALLAMLPRRDGAGSAQSPQPLVAQTDE
jgi:hypothetical protein